MSYDLVIKNGRLVTHADEFHADIGIRAESIVAIGRGLAGRREIDATGQFVLPGAIDGHVHLTDPTMPPFAPATADSFSTASAAAAFGGVTTLIDFASPAPGKSLLEELERRQEDADGHTAIDYALHLNLRDPDPQRLDELPEIFARGVPSLKLFMNYDGYRLPDDAIFRAMEVAAAHNGLAVVHAENYDVIRVLKTRLESEGSTGAAWHAAASPSLAEGEAVHRALALAKLAGARCLIFHISCREGVRELGLARRRGQEAYGETCPQYLFLSAAEYETPGDRAESLMIIPPLRDREHQEALWAGLADATLDIVSTDHNPRARESDHRPPGTSGVETRLALLYTGGVLSGRLSRQRWVEMCCTAPARVFGLRNKGRLSPGCDADIVLFDPEKKARFSADALHSPIDFCTYDGFEVTGYPTTTLSRGKVIVADGEFLAEPGRGRFVERSFD